jgi:hypothetical protein
MQNLRTRLKNEPTAEELVTVAKPTKHFLGEQNDISNEDYDFQ